MLGTTARDMLGRRLEDEDLAQFPLLNRVDAINNSTLRLANILDNDLLEELRTTDDLIPASGVIALSGLSPALLRNGVLNVYDNANTTWLHLVDPMDLKKSANGYLAPGVNYRIAYVFGANLNVDPQTADITVWYLGVPTDLTTTTIADGSTTLQLNTALHPIIVDMAEAELWRQDGKSEKADSILATAYKEIAVLNERALAEKKELIGRKSQK